MPFAEGKKTGTYNFEPLIAKIVLSELALAFTTLTVATAECFVPYNTALHLINGISNDHQKLHRYFNGTAIAAFFGIPFSFVIIWYRLRNRFS